MRFSVLYVLGLVLSLLPVTPVVAKPVEIKSENFILIGDISPSAGKHLLTEMEKYRFAIMDLYGVRSLPEPIPVRIYTAMGARELKDMSGLSGIGGVYTSNIEGPIFMLNAKGGFGHGKSGRKIAIHEYTHHLVAAYTDQYYPRWYGEGHADYLSTFKVDKKGKMVMGLAEQSHGYPLALNKWIPAKTVFGAINKYPFVLGSNTGNKIGTVDFFYAQSWLAVHYIQSHPEYTKNMSKYIDLLNSEQRPDNVFETAFGISMDDFQLKLKDYFVKNNYKAFAIEPTKLSIVKPLKVRYLSKGEFAFHKAEAMRYYRGSAISTQKMIDQYRTASKRLGETPYILAGLAELATWKDDFDAATAYINKALLQAPDDPKVNHMAGMILVYKNEEQSTNESKNELRQARRYLKKAMIANPDNISAHFYYAKSFGLTNQRPNAQGLASAETALEYYRGNRFLDSNLMLVDVLIRGGKTEMVRPAIQRAIVWGTNGATIGRAIELRGYLDSKVR
ncbi:MAG: hypothetical protein JKY46_04365 [Robiginitomaculum sp.]|nr:hypothetical protein [Robiginitomaculum sp.]